MKKTQKVILADYDREGKTEMNINDMTDEEYHAYREEQRRPREPIFRNYSESRKQWHNNVSPHVEMAYWSEWKRRKCADKLGPNWASVMSGCGDQ